MRNRRRRFSMEPCAYCCESSKDPKKKRIRGHVVPNCIYPNDTPLTLQELTVPECLPCKKLFDGTDERFRAVIVIAGGNQNKAMEQWNGPLGRSLTIPSGRKLLEVIKEQDIKERDGSYYIFPGVDPIIMFVIRKIIRGLCYDHNVDKYISDRRVWATALEYVIPPGLKEELTFKNLGPSFFEYAYSDERYVNEEDFVVQSSWYLKFYEKLEFIGFVSDRPLFDDLRWGRS